MDTQVECMVTLASDAIAGAAQLAIKWMLRVVVVVVGDYPIIELVLCIRVAIPIMQIYIDSEMNPGRSC